MSRPLRLLVGSLVVAGTLTSCMHPLPGRRPIVQDGQPGIAYKLVMRKMDPNYLIAVDQTTCQVSADRYRQVREGQRVLCDWKAGSLHTAPAGRPR